LRWKKYMRIASGIARRTPSRACSSKVFSETHIARTGIGGAVAVLTSSGSVRRRQAVPTRTTSRPARHPTAMWAAAQRNETSSNRFAVRAISATSR
jgi:hypothetical protein